MWRHSLGGRLSSPRSSSKAVFDVEVCVNDRFDPLTLLALLVHVVAGRMLEEHIDAVCRFKRYDPIAMSDPV